MYTVNYPLNGLNIYNTNKINMQKYNEKVTSIFEENDIIIADYYTDKLVFPERENIIAFDKPNLNLDIDQNKTKNEIFRVLNEAILNDEKIKIAIQGGYQDSENFLKELKYEYALTEIDKSSGGILTYTINGSLHNDR